VIDAYALTLAALLLTAGSIADLAGRRRVFATGIVVFTLGSALCGLASATTFLALARGLQGTGGATMFATSLALLADAFEPRERGVAFAVFGAITGIAVAVGPVLGGAITSELSWRWIFLVNLPIGAFALMVTLLTVRESRPPSPAPRLGRIRHLLDRPRRACLRPDPQPAGRLGLANRRRLADRRGPVAGRLPPDRGPRTDADARPATAARVDVRRRADRRLGDLGLDLLAADLHRHLPAGHPGRLRDPT
jgi:MFS family permease